MTSPVNFVWNTDRTVSSVHGWVMSSFAPVLVKWGFRIEGTTEESMRFVRRRSFWPMILISPLAFFVSPYQKDEVVISIIPRGATGARMTVLGELPKKIVDVVLQLPQAPAAVVD